MRIDFARLNYILIPKKKEDIDRYRASRAGRAIAPFARLWGSTTDEGRALLIMTLVCGALSVNVRFASAYLLFCMLVGILFGSIVAARFLVVRGLEITASAPRRVTRGEEVIFTITCKLDAHERQPTPPLRIRGPFLTWDGTWTDRSPGDVHVRPGKTASVTMRARFTARGMHHLDPFVAGAVLPLGLACGPRLESGSVKIHVVPKIANVTRLSLPVLSRHQPGGVALASKSGESRDLLGVRPYRPGDPIRDLHARTWARAGIPIVREYVQEYFTRVGVVLDTDIGDPDALEAAIELAAGVIAHLSRGEALVDVLVVGDAVHELTLGRSLGTLDQALELLGEVERGPALRASTLLGRLRPYLERLSSVVVIARSGDGERDRLAKEIERHGPKTMTIVVDDAIQRAIRAGEELAP